MKKIAVIGLSESWSSQVLLDAVEKKTGFRLLMEMQDISLDLEKGQVTHQDQDLAELDAIIIKKIGTSYSPVVLDKLEILHFLAQKGKVRIFSPPQNIMRLLNRLSCTTALRAEDLPVPPTVVTENLQAATRAVARFERAVLKPLYTSKARGMKIIDNSGDVTQKLRDFQAQGNSIIYVQKLVKHPGRDFGITFLGGKYFASYARVAGKKSWNTTIREGGHYQPYEPSEKILKIAEKAQKLFQMDFTCVDMVETPEGPMVFEVSAFNNFRGLLEAQQICVATHYVDYVLRQLS